MRLVLRMYLGIMAAWTIAWLLKLHVVDSLVPWLATSLGSFTWWTVAKVVIWILPAAWLIRRSGRTVAEVVGLARWRSALAWGGGIGFAIALTALVPAYLDGRALLPTTMSVPLFSVLTVAPAFEEFLARGALLGGLQQTTSFARANLFSALMFLGMHLPGWYFMGSLGANLTRPAGGAVSIVLLGLAFGYAVHRSRSVLGGTIAHFLNNLAANA